MTVVYVFPLQRKQFLSKYLRNIFVILQAIPKLARPPGSASAWTVYICLTIIIDIPGVVTFQYHSLPLSETRCPTWGENSRCRNGSVLCFLKQGEGVAIIIECEYCYKQGSVEDVELSLHVCEQGSKSFSSENLSGSNHISDKEREGDY